MVSNLQPIAKPFLPDQFVQFVGVAGSDAVSPADHSKVQRAGRLIGNVQHPNVHQEESQLPQEGESAHPLLVYSLALVFQFRWLGGVECTGEIKERDCYFAASTTQLLVSSLQQVDEH